MLNDADLRKKLKAFCKGKTQAAAAKQLNVTPAQLSRTLSGALPTIPARIVKKLGYQAVTVYVPKGRTATKSIKVARDATTGRTVSKATAKANPKGTVTETVKRAVKPAPRKSTAQKNREFMATVEESADDLVAMIDKGPIIATIPDDNVIDFSKKD